MAIIRIITSKQEKQALSLITQIRHVIDSDNFVDKLRAQEALAILTGIIGGLNGLTSELEKINSELSQTIVIKDEFYINRPIKEDN